MKLLLNLGATLEIITDKSQEGAQFVRGFGGIGGEKTLIYIKLTYQQVENSYCLLFIIPLQVYIICRGNCYITILCLLLYALLHKLFYLYSLKLWLSHTKQINTYFISCQCKHETVSLTEL